MWLLDELAKLKKSDKIAVINREEKVSFAELWQRSELLCKYIFDNKFAEGESKNPIVIYGNKETDILAVMHASLKSGLAYVPVDTSYPVDRLMQIIEQVKPKLVINFSDNFFYGDFTVLTAKNIVEIYNGSKNYISDYKKWVQDDDICYILFTSGSTGKPKGVPITKRNLTSFAGWFKEYCSYNSKPIVLNQAAYSFDLSVIALYVYLPLGGALFSVGKETLNDFGKLFNLFETSCLTDWVSTPSFLEICGYEDVFGTGLLPKLNNFIFDGERLRKEAVNIIKDRFIDARIINAYGPTEGTVAISACEIETEMVVSKDELPIGKIKPGTKYIIADADMAGIGELYIMGDTISAGYFKDEEKTLASFFMDEDKIMGYKTGDLCYLKDDLLYYVERKDFQIKLNGYRIELEDITSNINKLANVDNSIVLPITAEGKVQYLTAYIKLKKDLNEPKLRMEIFIKNELKKLVPTYMIPKKIVFVKQFPLNVNGKIDRKKLLEEYK